MTDAAQEMELSAEEAQDIAAKGWRSFAEYCRMFLPDWFPSKMPWLHRGIAALRTGQTEWLLDFGDEWWPEDIIAGTASQWTPEDLVELIANFVIPVDPDKPTGDAWPLFSAEFDAEGNFTRVWITKPNENNAFALPRGFSKTTLMNALNLRDVNYREAPFILYVSEASGHAEKQVITIRRQLEQNTLIRAVFGDCVPSRQSSLKWTDNLIETTTGQRVGGVGSGGQIRGMSIDATRPSRIVVDDFQDRETVKVEAQREKDVSWFIGTLMPARQIFGANTSKVDFIGTILHKDAVLARLRLDPDWSVVTFGALNRQGKPTWRYAIDEEKLAKLKASFLLQGKLEEFELEYMSNVIEDRTVAFPMDKLTVIRREEDWYIAKALTLDPAISEAVTADYCCFSVTGIGSHGRIHVQDFHGEIGMDPADQVEKLFELYFAHLAGMEPEKRFVGIEAVAFQRALLSMVKAKQHEKSRTWGEKAYFEVIPLLHGKTGKMTRVQGLLSPRWRAGHISAEFHFPILETHLSDWPNGKKDGPDVVAMGVGLLDPYAPLNMGTEVEADLPNREKGAGEKKALAAAQAAWARKAP
jgi:hypothetical protein